MMKKALEEELKRYKEEEELRGEAPVEEEVKDLDAREYYCEICDKEFKTENQLLNHNQSKIHLKNVKDLLDEVAIGDEKEKALETAKAKEKKIKKNKKKNKENDFHNV